MMKKIVFVLVFFLVLIFNQSLVSVKAEDTLDKGSSNKLIIKYKNGNGNVLTNLDTASKIK